MPTYAKFCPNVFVAKCETQHEKGDTIFVTTKYGKENESVVHNYLGQKEGFYYYSITRADGSNTQTFAEKRAARLHTASTNAENKSNQYFEASQEGCEFLRLAEPIKIGHHSEKRHRGLINRNHNRMRKCVEFAEVAKNYEYRAEYWEKRTEKIDLSMPESIEYYKFILEQAERLQQELKANPAKRDHSFSLPYATKAVKEAKKNIALAKRLWA
jgi:hypothetical protein